MTDGTSLKFDSDHIASASVERVDWMLSCVFISKYQI